MIERDGTTKIAFVGTSCIGKTTLLEHYHQRFNGNPQTAIVEEAARLYFSNNPNIHDRFSAETQARVQSLVLQNEQEAHDSGAKVILCDRSVIDAVAYTRAHGDREGAEQLLERVQFWLATYYKFMLLNPADIQYANDDIRQEDEVKRQQFHLAFIDLFDEKQIPYELLSESLEKRINRINQILDQATREKLLVKP